jgi:hypothetical protein
MRWYQISIWIVVAIAVIGAVYVGLGSRALWDRRERPARIVGRRVKLGEFEEYGPTFPGTALGVVREYLEPQYLVEFDPTVTVDGHPERHAWIRARHKGWPVSSAGRRRVLAVSGTFESGTGFISLVVTT